MTLQEAKDQIAKNNGKESWYLWGYEYSEPYGKEIPSKYLEEAAELYGNAREKEGFEHWDEVRDFVSNCKSSNIKIGDWIPARVLEMLKEYEMLLTRLSHFKMRENQ